MKQKLLNSIFFAVLTLFIHTDALAWGETTSYVLDAPAEYTLNTIETGPTLALSGPGATLTFQAKRQTAAFNYFYVQTSTDGGNSWKDFQNPSLGTSYSTYTYNININVTHIRFITKTGATLRKYYKNVKVTRATTLSTSTTTLNFGTVTNRQSSTQNALINYNNTTYNQQVTGTCTDPNFTVTATSVGATGNNQAIPVTFTPTTAGTHTGTVTLTMNGKTVTFQVTGVGQTTYYTRATASATDGGSAYVSFASFDEATTNTDTKNSGVTTASNASTTVFYQAVPNKRYAFVGWKRDLNDATYVSTDANFQTTYTYNSEDSNNPTVVTYYAFFEEKPNVITLEPSNSEYDADLYETVTLHRTLLQGYNTIALPFSTNVQELTRRTNDDDWVAQLSTVTYNQHDGFTLFFEKVANGEIHAFEPYILYLGEQVVDPSWTNIDLPAASPTTITPSKGYSVASSPDGNSSYSDWQMTSNFTAGYSMNGIYGIVNSIGALQRGGATSTINAFTAYITPAPGASGVKIQSAYTDEWGNTTVVPGLPTDKQPQQTASAMYTLSGQRLNTSDNNHNGRGIRIVQGTDGHFRKILY